VADQGLPGCLAIWADAVRLEERNYPAAIQRKGQQKGMQELQRHHPTVYCTPGKAFALTLLARVKTKLLEVRRPEQSGFTPHRSTVDRIATLNTLLQTRKEFNKPLWIAYVNLKSAFDSVDRESLWLLLRRHGIPDKLVELMKELYTDTCSCVLADGMRSEWFQVLSGVSQGCTIAPDLFLNPMVWIMSRTVEQIPLGVSIGEESFSDLDYSGDVTLLAEMLETLVTGLLVL